MSNKILRMVNFKLYLMRHGQTNGNLHNLAHGVTDEPLNDTGRAQAAKAANALSSVAFSHAYCSDLRRASETARIVLGGGGWGDRLPLADPVLREQDFGPWEAREVRDIKAELAAKGIQDAFYRHLPEGAETVDQMKRRLKVFFEGLCEAMRSEAKDDTSVLVVSHGLAILTLFDHMSTLCANPPPPLTMLPNTAYVVCHVSCSPEACEVEFVKPCEWSHLQE